MASEAEELLSRDAVEWGLDMLANAESMLPDKGAKSPSDMELSRKSARLVVGEPSTEKSGSNESRNAAGRAGVNCELGGGVEASENDCMLEHDMGGVDAIMREDSCCAVRGACNGKGNGLDEMAVGVEAPVVLGVVAAVDWPLKSTEESDAKGGSPPDELPTDPGMRIRLSPGSMPTSGRSMGRMASGCCPKKLVGYGS